MYKETVPDLFFTFLIGIHPYCQCDGSINYNNNQINKWVLNLYQKSFNLKVGTFKSLQ